MEIEDMSYEDAVSELETIVRRLEGGNLALEESIALYERANTLRERCEALLTDAERRVQILAHGSADLEDFEAER